jgi:hypothetical protein
MAAPDSWPSIRDNGLLSTTELLNRFDVVGSERLAIEARHRPDSVTISKDGMGKVIIRDQKPMSDSGLLKCLMNGLRPADWYRILNARSFFWLSQPRLRRLLGARAYRNTPQTVLTIDTRSLVNKHLERVELSPINSGSTIYRPVPRGLDTFMPIEKYDYVFWRKKRNALDAVVELVVRGGVPDIKDHVLAVHDFRDGQSSEIWRRPGTAQSIGP